MGCTATRVWLVFILALLVSAFGGYANACGSDSACTIEGGEYRIAMPDNWDGTSRVGAILFLHGWRGSAEAEMRNQALLRTASSLGVALIAAQGLNGGWSFPGSPSHDRDEFSFFDALLDDVVDRFAIDHDRIMASGFSLGGSMVWYLACRMSDRFAGFAPVAGGFWNPPPPDCDGPVPNLVHVHGLSDRTVPMSGRPIGEHAHQGDILAGMEMWFRHGRCADETPVETSINELACEKREACSGSLIEFCIHPGGHSLKAEWIARAWREVAARKGWPVPAAVQ